MHSLTNESVTTIPRFSSPQLHELRRELKPLALFRLRMCDPSDDKLRETSLSRHSSPSVYAWYTALENVAVRWLIWSVASSGLESNCSSQNETRRPSLGGLALLLFLMLPDDIEVDRDISSDTFSSI